MGRIVVAALALLFAACAPHEAGPPLLDDGEPDPDVPAVVSPEALRDWNAVADEPDVDRPAPRLSPLNGDVAVSTGPPGLVWRRVDFVAAGDFQASAIFEARDGTDPGTPPDGLGLFVGGTELAEPHRGYTVFLVQGDRFAVERTEAGRSRRLVDWTELPEDLRGQQARRVLSVQVRGERVVFLVGGSAVTELPLEEAPAHGAAGIRVGEEVDVVVRGLSVSLLNPPDGASSSGSPS